MKLFNTEYKKRDLLKHIGDISTVACVRKYKFEGGMLSGVNAIDVRNQQGLEFTVLADRCMDIAWCSYKGIPISYVSKTGFTSPYLCEHKGIEYLRNFGCGLLTTCGFSHFGGPCEDEGKEYSLHGRATSLIADEVSAYGEWVGDDYVMTIRGHMRQSMVFFENIHMIRVITAKAGEKKIKIEDSFENHSFNDEPFMLLYHCNFGFPILSKNTKILTSKVKQLSFQAEYTEEEIAKHNLFDTPTHGYQEKIFYYDLEPGADGKVCSCLYNEQLGLGAYIKYSKEQLPVLLEWKMIGESEYVCGMEPGTWIGKGRAEARRRGELLYLKPGEIKVVELEIGILESAELNLEFPGNQ